MGTDNQSAGPSSARRGSGYSLVFAGRPTARGDQLQFRGATYRGSSDIPALRRASGGLACLARKVRYRMVAGLLVRQECDAGGGFLGAEDQGEGDDLCAGVGDAVEQGDECGGAVPEPAQGSVVLRGEAQEGAGLAVAAFHGGAQLVARFGVLPREFSGQQGGDELAADRLRGPPCLVRLDGVAPFLAFAVAFGIVGELAQVWVPPRVVSGPHR